MEQEDRPLDVRSVVECLELKSDDMKLGDTADWTRVVLSKLQELGHARGMCVDPSPEPREAWSTKGEWFWDLTISTYPPYEKDTLWNLEYFQKAVNQRRPLGLELVAECEWGKRDDPKTNAFKVLEDFVKLTAARANIKVMVFSYYESSDGPSSWDNLRHMMVELRQRSEDRSPYILMGVGWLENKVRGPEVIEDE